MFSLEPIAFATLMKKLLNVIKLLLRMLHNKFFNVKLINTEKNAKNKEILLQKLKTF
jgi:hypothetical protein